MGKLAQAAAEGPLKAKVCPTAEALLAHVEDVEDEAVISTLVAKKKWTALSELIDVAETTVRRHYGVAGRCGCDRG